MATHLSLKLLVDAKSKRVLFAEAGKDVVDFLFGLMTMPVGSVIRLLTTKGMAGCIGNIYQSVESLDYTYLKAHQHKDVLLRPRAQSPPLSPNTLLLENDASSTTTAKKYFRCTSDSNCNGYRYVTYGNGTLCRSCRRGMAQEMTYVDPKAGKVMMEGGEMGSGYVKGVVTYMVMDDLTVTPMSTISSLTLLNSLNVTDVSSLEERTVEMGLEQGLELLKASFLSTTVLTDVFLLGKNKSRFKVLGHTEEEINRDGGVRRTL